MVSSGDGEFGSLGDGETDGLSHGSFGHLNICFIIGAFKRLQVFTEKSESCEIFTIASENFASLHEEVPLFLSSATPLLHELVELAENRRKVLAAFCRLAEVEELPEGEIPEVVARVESVVQLDKLLEFGLGFKVRVVGDELSCAWDESSGNDLGFLGRLSGAEES